MRPDWTDRARLILSLLDRAERLKANVPGLNFHARAAVIPRALAPAERGPYVDGPMLARVLLSADRIACDHMSGLLPRLRMAAAKMVSAT